MATEQANELTAALNRVKNMITLEDLEDKGTIFDGVADAYDAITSGKGSIASARNDLISDAKELQKQSSALSILRDGSSNRAMRT